MQRLLQYLLLYKSLTSILLSLYMYRHDRRHTLMPTKINYRANIWALKEVGCTHVIASSACGSLQESFQPGDFVFPDQFIDRTTKRPSTFYDGEDGHPPGICHIAMHEPFCKSMRKVFISRFSC